MLYILRNHDEIFAVLSGPPIDMEDTIRQWKANRIGPKPLEPECEHSSARMQQWISESVLWEAAEKQLYLDEFIIMLQKYGFSKLDFVDSPVSLSPRS